MSNETLPRGWRTARVEDLATLVQYGSSSKTSEDETGVPVLRMGNIVNGRLVFEALKYLPPEHQEFPELLLRPGDVLFNRTNSPELVGKTAVYSAEHPSPCSFASYLIRLRLRDYEPSLFAAYVNSGYGRAWIRSCVSQQVGQANVSGGKLRELQVPVPPRNEQRRIVAKLETLQARSRRAREALDAVPPLLEKLRQSILAAAFRGDLTKDWRAKNKDVEPASKLLERIRAERRKKWEESELAKLKAKGKPPTDDKWKSKYKEPVPVDTPRLPELPQGWCWISIETAGDVLLGRRRAAQEYVAGRDGRVMRSYVRVANVKEDRLDLSDVLEMPFNDVELGLYRLLPGDIILSEGQSPELVGQSAVFKGEVEDLCIQATVHRFRAYSSGTSSAFAQLVFLNHLHSRVFMRASSLTTNIAHLTSERLKPLPFPLPPMAEQAEIVRRVRKVLERTNGIATHASQLRSREKSLSTAIVAKAFRGELVPQDPSNASAQGMLTRSETTTSGAANGGTSVSRESRRRATRSTIVAATGEERQS